MGQSNSLSPIWLIVGRRRLQRFVLCSAVVDQSLTPGD
jgi:hypothetical protein